MNEVARACLWLALCLLGWACAHRPPDGFRQGRLHVVQKGETASGIARAYGVSLRTLVLVNGLEDPSALYVGQALRIPRLAKKEGPGLQKALAPPHHRTPSAPTTPALPRETTHSEGAAPAARRLAADCRGHEGAGGVRTVSRAGFRWPVDGIVVSRFGRREGLRHEGLDIAAPAGTPVLASARGKVVYVGEQSGYGRLVIVQHPGARLSIYAHNLKNCVAEGQTVDQGGVLALVGQSGQATSPLVHFEVRIHGKPVDPRPLLPLD